MLPGEILPEYQRNPDGSLKEELFAYVVTTPALVRLVETPVGLRIDNDADFIWERASYFAPDTLVAKTEDDEIVPLVTIRIIDPLSQRALMSSEVPLTSIFGMGEYPFYLPEPKRIPASATLQMFLTGFQAVGVGTYPALRLEFTGIKRFLATQNVE